MSFKSDIRKTINYLQRNGAEDTYFAAKERVLEKFSKERYVYEPVTKETLDAQRAIMECLDGGDSPESVFGPEILVHEMPLLSILVPAYETGEAYMRMLVESVANQTYSRWELILVDASTDDQVKDVVTPYAEADERIHYYRLPENKGISENTNAAATFATGDFVVFLDHDDFLEPNALFEAAMGILKTDPEILYTDEDKCNEDATSYFEPNRKPDYDTDYFLSNNYICHMLVVKRGLFLSLKLRSEYDGAQDYDLLLRAPRTKVTHIAKILYHWRVHPGSTAGSPQDKSYAAEAGRRALEDYFKTKKIKAEVTHSRHKGFYNVNYLPDIFAAREEVGVVGGKVIDRHSRIIGGLISEDGSCPYNGHHVRESGTMHRMDTRQDAYAVDVRCMKIRRELEGVYREVFGVPYEAHVLRKDDGLKEKSIAFSRKAAELGYLIVFDPEMVVMEK